MLDRKVALKTLGSYPKSVVFEAGLLSIEHIKAHNFGQAGATPFGSYTYRIQKYPGDVDLQERYTFGTSISDVVPEVAKRLGEIVAKIEATPDHFYSEMKIGEDRRFDLELGLCSEGDWVVDPTLLPALRKLKPLFPADKYRELMSILDPGTAKVVLGWQEYDRVYNLIRDMFVLRWTATEVMSGKKQLPGNRVIGIEEAVNMKAHVKLDIIAILDGKFVEVTNFMLLGYQIPGTDKIQPINADYDFTDEDAIRYHLRTQLKEEIERLILSTTFFSPFKAIKRIFALARNYKNMGVIQIFSTVVSSNLSLLYQLKSELDAILIVLLGGDSIPVARINQSIDYMKNRIANVLELSDRKLDDFNTQIDRILEAKKIAEKAKLIESFKAAIMDVVNTASLEFLTKVGFNPPARDSGYLPDQLTYYYGPVYKQQIKD